MAYHILCITKPSVLRVLQFSAHPPLCKHMHVLYISLKYHRRHQNLVELGHMHIHLACIWFKGWDGSNWVEPMFQDIWLENMWDGMVPDREYSSGEPIQPIIFFLLTCWPSLSMCLVLRVGMDRIVLNLFFRMFGWRTDGIWWLLSGNIPLRSEFILFLKTGEPIQTFFFLLTCGPSLKKYDHPIPYAKRIDKTISSQKQG